MKRLFAKRPKRTQHLIHRVLHALMTTSDSGERVGMSMYFEHWGPDKYTTRDLLIHMVEAGLVRPEITINSSGSSDPEAQLRLIKAVGGLTRDPFHRGEGQAPMIRVEWSTIDLSLSITPAGITKYFEDISADQRDSLDRYGWALYVVAALTTIQVIVQLSGCPQRVTVSNWPAAQGQEPEQNEAGVFPDSTSLQGVRIPGDSLADTNSVARVSLDTTGRPMTGGVDTLSRMKKKKNDGG